MPAPKGWNPHATHGGGNLKRGERHEDRIERKYKRDGWKVERSGWGSDFKATKNGHVRYIECKTGTGRLTPKQKRRKARVGKRYKVYRA